MPLPPPGIFYQLGIIFDGNACAFCRGFLYTRSQKKCRMEFGDKTAWLTSCTGNALGCVKQHQKWRFLYIKQSRENNMCKKITNVCFYSPCTHLRVHKVMLANMRSGYWKCGKGRLYARKGLLLLRFLVSTQMKHVQIIVNIDVSVKHCRFWNIRKNAMSFWFVLSVEYAPETAPATASMRHWPAEYFLYTE